MTKLAIDFLGYTYDQATPSFIIASDDFVFHRPTARLLDFKDLQTRITAANYVLGQKEMSKNDAWLNKHIGMSATPTGGRATQPPAQNQDPTFAVAGTGTATATIDVSLGGNPSSAGTITVTGLAVDGDAITGVTTVTVSAGDTGHDLAVELGAAIDAKSDAGNTKTVHTSVAGSKVTITEDNGGNIDAGFTVTFA